MRNGYEIPEVLKKIAKTILNCMRELSKADDKKLNDFITLFNNSIIIKVEYIGSLPSSSQTKSMEY